MVDVKTVRSKAPLRLGLAGGGTDVSPYCDLYGGVVLNATINMYAHCVIRPRNDDHISMNLADQNKSLTVKADKILKTDDAFNLIAGVHNRIISNYGFQHLSCDITTFSDAPPGSGLGSSSAMVVALIKAFAEWLELPLGEYEIAELAYKIERVDLGMSGGRQDQFASTFGGFNFIEFEANDRVIVNPLRIKRWIIDELEESIVLYYTGASRFSSAIIDEQKINVRSNNNLAIEAMHSIKKSTFEMKASLLKGDTNAFAKILGSSWESKKKMASSISNNLIDELMNVAFENGALSGKVSGAGGGGFIFFFVNPENKPTLKRALETFDGRIFDFQFTEGGTHSWKIFH